jgi:hypothetical protein
VSAEGRTSPPQGRRTPRAAFFQSLDGFATGDGANHDALLSSSAFDGASQGLLDAMSQAGAHVVIMLQATDEITLANVSLGSLTGADLKIV